MTNVVKTALLVGFMGLGSTSAMAPGWAANDPRRAEVNGRLGDQNRRIDNGVKDGQLSASQATALHQEDLSIRSEERTEASLDGGHITAADKRSLNQQENAVSHQIYDERH